MVRTTLRAGCVALLLSTVPALAGQATAPKKTPPPKAGGVSVQSGESVSPPPGAKPAEIQDVRVLPERPDDPYEFERLGYAAYQAGELTRAREFFDRSWKAGELPTAAYNLACLDALAGKQETAFAELDKAVRAGFDDEKALKNDKDLASLRGSPRFAALLHAAARSQAEGQAAVVKEGIFLGPGRPAAGILLVLHDASSDPLTASGPFTAAAAERGLFLAVPRGPAKAGRKRFGWGAADRAYAAVDAALEAARAKAGNPKLPVAIVGIARGGTLAFSVAARRPGVFAAVGSIGGPYDPGTNANPETAAGLRGSRLFLGVCRDAPQVLKAAFKSGLDSLKQRGFAPAYSEWPGTGTSFPNDVGAAVRETLDALVRSAAPATARR